MNQSIPEYPNFIHISDALEPYLEMTSNFPSYSDIDLQTLNIWWNLEGELKIARIDSNLIINYSLPL